MSGKRIRLTFNLDVLDGVQLAQGMFAASLVLARMINPSSTATAEVQRIMMTFVSHGDVVIDAMLMIYAVACLTCLLSWHSVTQFVVAVCGVTLWAWMGAATILAAPHHVAVVGIYELMMAIGSVIAIYFRGRQV